MRASRIHHRGPATFEMNMTPLIDMAFLLIVFFVLVSQITSAENVELDLPQPSASAARAPGSDPRIVVNVVPAADGGAAGYRLGKREFAPDAAGLRSLVAALAGAMKGQPGIEINIRADRATAYSWVRPAMDAVADALAESGLKRDRTRVKLVVLGGQSDG